MATLDSGRIGTTCGKAGAFAIDQVRKCARNYNYQTFNANSHLCTQFGVVDSSGWALDLGVGLS
jgi:hypothetical protein